MSSPAPGASLRPLPSRPNLELERKHAKLLLRQLRAAEPDALARARATIGTPRRSAAAPFKLADAQLILAREYGFLSWPRLVQYFGDVSRLPGRSVSGPLDREFYKGDARGLIARHHSRRPLVGRLLAASIPRFYGLSVDEVFASSIDESEARLTVARQQGLPSWDAFMERLEIERARRSSPRPESSLDRRIRPVIAGGDIDALRRVLDEHPSLLRPSEEEWSRGRAIAIMALDSEAWSVVPTPGQGPKQRLAVPPATRAATDWLISEGADVARAATEALCARMFLRTPQVQVMLDRGADIHWVAPNGLSVLEHALLLYWNGEAVDLIAARTTAPRALWVAAGLGDVDGVARFLDRGGKPTAAAHRTRPDFGAVPGPHRGMLRHPVADDIDVLVEAFYVAMINDRIEVLDYLIDKGFPIDYTGWDMPFLNFAAGNQRLKTVECLVRRGAGLDVRGRHPDTTAREMARERFESMPDDPTATRILELCGGNPAEVRAELATRPVPEPEVSEKLLEIFKLAGDDAARLGQSTISDINILIGLLRSRAASTVVNILAAAGVDVDRLHAELTTRLLPLDDLVVRDKLPFDATIADVLPSAVAVAKAQRAGAVMPWHVLRALAERDDTPLQSLLAQFGSSAERLRATLDKQR